MLLASRFQPTGTHQNATSTPQTRLMRSITPSSSSHRSQSLTRELPHMSQPFSTHVSTRSVAPLTRYSESVFTMTLLTGPRAVRPFSRIRTTLCRAEMAPVRSPRWWDRKAPGGMARDLPMSLRALPGPKKTDLLGSLWSVVLISWPGKPR